MKLTKQQKALSKDSKKAFSITGYKFADTDTLMREDINIDFLKQRLSSRHNFGVDNIMRGYYLETGWRYDVRDLLKRYLYKQYGRWYECYALNKTNLRSLVYGRIDEIIEL